MGHGNKRRNRERRNGGMCKSVDREWEKRYASATMYCPLVFGPLSFRIHSCFLQQPDPRGNFQTCLPVCLCNKSVLKSGKRGPRDRQSYRSDMPVKVSGDSAARLSGVYTEYWEEKEHSIFLQVEISSTIQWNYLNPSADLIQKWPDNVFFLLLLFFLPGGSFLFYRGNWIQE